ncbi:MAG TPA: hypothetical protein VH120_00465, partial [Gemmataceae bacterium]|nr:hypothetical protein [Gemmataceae bacterium]
VRIEIPLCRPCQVDRTRRRRRAVMLGLAAGLAPGLLGLLLGSPFLATEDLIILGLILIPVGLFLGLIGGLIAREMVDPARFKEYSASAGTVAMKLRPSTGSTAFRLALGLGEESEPARVGASVG